MGDLDHASEPIPRRLSNTWWNVARRKAGIDDLHFHDLRHEFGSQLLEAGGELHEVQATLGHTNVKMTSTHLNATTQGIKQAFKKLEAKRRRQNIKVRSWPAADQRERSDDGVKSLVRRAIIPHAGVAELADAQDLKFCDPKGSCGFDSRPRHQWN